MTKQRSNAFEGLFSDEDEEELGEPVDVGGFTPRKAQLGVRKEVVRAASEQAGLLDRAGGERPPAKSEQRARPLSSNAEFRRSKYYRTGRGVQINMKGRPEDKARLVELCNAHEWVQGQVLEYALDALMEKVTSGKDDPFWSGRSFHGVDLS